MCIRDRYHLEVEQGDEVQSIFNKQCSEVCSAPIKIENNCKMKSNTDTKILMSSEIASTNNLAGEWIQDTHEETQILVDVSSTKNR